MRTLDFAPLHRSTVGFDRVASLLDNLLTDASEPQTYPPYDIEKTGEASYRITIAVAGFTGDEIAIESRENALVISATRARPAEGAEGETPKTVYLHRGIAKRGFERRFQLADHVRATDASLENGLLHVDLVREVPEALKPRRIRIASLGSPTSAAPTVGTAPEDQAA
ncbi:Hsp20 family protein [Neomegalonema sp.]|uniref:Hsp20 family protein n=1 Tax=Neomegalonema sp. TaxID=2039713 RepID=UPI00260D47AE|nr:Hsp20 family protein [Neomegalonema sp.]MDD2867165.1 Hsp20 family protein [Neomegalonema sp.]